MQRNKIWVVIVGGLVLVAVMVLAAGLSGIDLASGQSVAPRPQQAESPFNLFSGQPRFRDLTLLSKIGIVILIIIPFAFIYTMLSPDMRRRAVFHAIFLTVVFFALYLFMRENNDLLEQLNEAVENSFQTPDVIPLEYVDPIDLVTNPPGWLTLLVVGAVVSLILFTVWAASRRLPPRVDQLERLAVEAQEAIDSLLSGADLKNTIMRCYFEMSQAVQAEHGITRAEGMTPREFEQSLHEAGLPPTHIKRLTRLFESVRYGAHMPGPDEEAEAIACLTAIVDASRSHA